MTNPESRIPNPGSRRKRCLAAEARDFAVYLQAHCRGRAAAQPKRVILPALRAGGVDVSSRDYDSLAGVAVGMGLAVGTGGGGAFYIETEGDQRAAEANLRTRFEPMRVHLAHLERLGRVRFGRQPLLETASHAENAEVSHG